MYQGPPIPNFSNIPFAKPPQACPMKKSTPLEPTTTFAPAPPVPIFTPSNQQVQPPFHQAQPGNQQVQPPPLQLQQPTQSSLMRVGAYDDILMQTRPKHVPGPPIQPIPQVAKGPVIVASDPPPFYNAESLTMGSMKMTYAPPPIIQQQFQQQQQPNQQNYFTQTKPSFESGFVNAVNDDTNINNNNVIPPERPGAPSPSEPIDLLAQAEMFLKSHASEVIVPPTPQMTFASSKPKMATVSFPNIIDLETWSRCFSSTVIQDDQFLTHCFSTVEKDVESLTREIVDNFVFEKLISSHKVIETPFLVPNVLRTPLVACSKCGSIFDALKLIEKPGETTYEGSSLDQIQKKIAITKSACQNPDCGSSLLECDVVLGWKNAAIIHGGTLFASSNKDDREEDATLYKKPPTSVAQKQMILKDADDTLGGFEYQKPASATNSDGGAVVEVKDEKEKQKEDEEKKQLRESHFKFARSQIVNYSFLDMLTSSSFQSDDEGVECYTEIGPVMKNAIGEIQTKKEDLVFNKTLSRNAVIALTYKDTPFLNDENNAKNFIESWESGSFVYKFKEDQFLSRRPSSLCMKELFTTKKKFVSWLPLLMMSQAVAIVHEVTGLSDRQPENEKQAHMFWRESQSSELLSPKQINHVTRWKLIVSLFRYAPHLEQKAVCTLDLFQRKGNNVLALEIDFNALVFYFLGASLRQDESRKHIWLSFPTLYCPYQCAIFTIGSFSQMVDETRVKFYRSLKQSGCRVLNVTNVFTTKEECFQWADERGIRNAIILDPSFSPEATTSFDFKAIVSDRKTLQQQPLSFLDITSFVQSQK